MSLLGLDMHLQFSVVILSGLELWLQCFFISNLVISNYGSSLKYSLRYASWDKSVEAKTTSESYSVGYEIISKLKYDR